MQNFVTSAQSSFDFDNPDDFVRYLVGDAVSDEEYLPKVIIRIQEFHDAAVAAAMEKERQGKAKQKAPVQPDQQCRRSQVSAESCWQGSN
jgi:hypothetical protein